MLALRYFSFESAFIIPSCSPWGTPALPAGCLIPSALHNAVISGLKTFTVGITRYHCTYASNKLLLTYLQGSIPGPWLAVTEAGSHPQKFTALPSRNQDLTPIFAFWLSLFISWNHNIPRLISFAEFSCTIFH